MSVVPSRRPTPPPQMEPSPLERAFENYQHMEAELAETRIKNQQLLTQNMGLVAEVHMLREALERSDTDRIRLQAVASTLLGRLLAINDAIAGAVKESVKHGIEAVEAHRPDQLERAGEEAQAIIQRVKPHDAIEAPASPKASQGAAQGVLGPVDWGLLPQGAAI